jgi:hypothetical protein
MCAASRNAEVELIVEGGAAAVIHGAPITTQDLDIVPQQRPDKRALPEQLRAAIPRVVDVTAR